MDRLEELKAWLEQRRQMLDDKGRACHNKNERGRLDTALTMLYEDNKILEKIEELLAQPKPKVIVTQYGEGQPDIDAPTCVEIEYRNGD
jgi:hypothetical protein